MENFKIESRYLKLFNEFRAVIRCINEHLFLTMRPRVRKLSQAFETLGRAFEGLRES